MNILEAILNLSRCEDFSLTNTEENVNNIVSDEGKPLEKFVRASFCGRPDSEESENVSKDVFCYEGGVNNPPDAMIRNQGDAIEIKKIESKMGGIQLNSSLPKQKLFSSDKMITDDAKTCENWESRDMLYVVGYVSNNNIRYLFFVYGDCIFRENQFYEDKFNAIKEALGSLDIEELDQTGNEYGTLKNVDGLNINTNMRLRPLNSFDNPLKIFSDIVKLENEDNFSMFTIMRDAKYETFMPEIRREIENSGVDVRDSTINDPDNQEQKVKIKILSFKN